MGEICDFGQYEKYIISPSYVHSLLSKPSTPIIDEIPIDEKELIDSPIPTQPNKDDITTSYFSDYSSTSATSHSSKSMDDIKDVPPFPVLQRCVSERLPSQHDHSSQLLWSRPSEHDELRHREFSDSFDLDELSPSASPPPNLVEYTHRHSRSVRENEEMEEKMMELKQKPSRKFSWQALLEDTTHSFMGYMKSIPN